MDSRIRVYLNASMYHGCHRRPVADEPPVKVQVGEEVPAIVMTLRVRM